MPLNSLYKKLSKYSALALVSVYGLAIADLKAMNEAELETIHGADLGIVFQDLQIMSDISGVNNMTTTTQITFDADEAGGETLEFSHLYLVAENGNRFTPSPGNGVNFGSAESPLTLAFSTTANTLLNDGSTGTRNAVSFCWSGVDCTNPSQINKTPTNTSTQADFGMRFDLVNGTSGFRDTTWVEFNGLNLDDTWLALWPDATFGTVFAGNLDVSIDQLRWSLEASGSGISGDFTSNNETATLTGIDINLQLGQPFYQPVTIGSTSSYNASTGNTIANFFVEVAPIPNIPTVYNQFYDTSTPTSSIQINNINLGGYNAGSVDIQGIQIQHLRVTTHDIAL